jgi:hypothetical protein
MKRKTNLFYVSGPDSKFLTFSNYTESLTGNFLSTNTKLFPDKFLCLKINNLNSTNKADFIKYLVRYYENKLASLRDAAVNNGNGIEKHLLPLSYLLEAIIQVCDWTYDNHNEKYNWTFNINNINNFNTSNFINSNYYNENNIKDLITYIGDITEQDYNGTYTDTICSINSNNYNIGTINYNNSRTSNTTNNVLNSYTETIIDTLYGWENKDIIFEDYIDVIPLFDDTVSSVNDNSYTYYFDTYLENIDIVKINTPTDPIVFNVIIPLFSLVNIDTETNTNQLTNNNVIYLKNNTSENGQLCSIFNVPLGIWINADEETDSFVELKKDNVYDTYPAWSLLISSQFKPFPYSLDKTVENNSQAGIIHAYPTFAEILTKINDSLDKFNELNIAISSINNELNLLKRQINEIGTTNNYSNLESNILKLKSDVKDEISEFKKQLYSYVDNITWSSKYKNNN